MWPNYESIIFKWIKFHISSDALICGLKQIHINLHCLKQWLAINPFCLSAKVPYKWTLLLNKIMFCFATMISFVWINSRFTKAYQELLPVDCHMDVSSTPKLIHMVWTEQGTPFLDMVPGHVLPMFGHLEIKLWLHEVESAGVRIDSCLSLVPRYIWTETCMFSRIIMTSVTDRYK